LAARGYVSFLTKEAFPIWPLASSKPVKESSRVTSILCNVTMAVTSYHPVLPVIDWTLNVLPVDMVLKAWSHLLGSGAQWEEVRYSGHALEGDHFLSFSSLPQCHELIRPRLTCVPTMMYYDTTGLKQGQITMDRTL
jgi:hypothetical protein